MKARIRNQAPAGDGLAEPQDDSLLGLRNGEQGSSGDDHADEECKHDKEGKGFHLRAPPWNGAKAGRGTNGETPPPPCCSSIITFSAPPSTRSIVSM